jgi:hypothetical protein
MTRAAIKEFSNGQTIQNSQVATIAPMHTQKVELGLFKEDGASPKFAVEYEQGKLNTVSYHDDSFSNGEVYRLVRHFSNFGDSPVSVKIYRTSGAQPAA